eukprot:TRINITY_DN6007_c0_g1_i1.p2 TRINITY_DN6007_c0_g1~~TRINITY_DN6007_c0_g1_i1.p2  ORF type:complete len:149 (+),score=32.37 TRINITY_DN6007_c0_g1_i1:62-508(+)
MNTTPESSLQSAITQDLKDLPPSLANCLEKFAESIDHMNRNFDLRLRAMERAVARLTEASNQPSVTFNRDNYSTSFPAYATDLLSSSPIMIPENEVGRSLSSRRSSAYVSPHLETMSTQRAEENQQATESFNVQFQCDTFGYQNFHNS